MRHSNSIRILRSFAACLLATLALGLPSCTKNNNRVAGVAGTDCAIVTGRWNFELVNAAGATVLRLENVEARQIGCNVKFEGSFLIGGVTKNSAVMTYTTLGTEVEVKGSFLPESGGARFVESTSFLGTWGGTYLEERSGGLAVGQRL